MAVISKSGEATSSFTDVFSSLPKEVYQISTLKAVRTLAVSVAFIVLGYLGLASAPLYLIPLFWLFLGAAATGLFVCGHDCGRYAFFNSEKLNSVVGTICFVPLLYPFEAWKFHYYLRQSWPQWELSFGALKTCFVRWWSRLSDYFAIWRSKQMGREMAAMPGCRARHPSLRICLSMLYVYAFIGITFPLLVWKVGIWGLIKYYIGPWVCLHVWKYSFRQSTFALEKPLKVKKVDNDGDGIVVELVQCRFPRWMEFLFHSFNLQITNYLVPKDGSEWNKAIPSYNLRLAYKALEETQTEVVRQYSFQARSLIGMKPSSVRTSEPVRAARSAQFAGQQHENRLDSKSETLPKKTLSDKQQINWLHVTLLTLLPLLSVYGIWYWSFSWATLAWAVVYYHCTGLGITAGYHRLWAHRAYKAAWPVRFALCLFGAGAVEGSIRWWCRDHRVHHRYTDTDKDPYNAKEGFFYSHIGWMLTKKPRESWVPTDISDLNADPMIAWQHTYYLPIMVTMTTLFPMMVAGLGWGDYWGGLFVAGIARAVFVQHSTFCVNSLAHSLGAQTYADKHTPRDSVITALVTLGEGYHNFHHEFPHDYRNGIKFYHYDPTKWTINILHFFGLASDLLQFPDNEIQKGKWQMRWKKLMNDKKNVKWPEDISSLPTMSMKEFKNQCSKGRELIIVDDLVHDVGGFLEHHPGGEKILRAYLGKDATSAFNGGVYDHSNAGRNLLSTKRIARLL